MTDEQRKALLDAFNVLVQAYVPKDVPQAQECVENIRQALTEPAVPDAPDDYILTAAHHAEWLLRSDSEWHRTVGASINKILKERHEAERALAQGTKNNDH